jgi:hypothetical protein
MSQPPRALPGQAWRHILWQNGLGPGLVIVFFWALYVAAAVYGIDIFDGDIGKMYLFLAVLFRDGTRQLVLVCDPRRPGRSMEKSNVWPDAPSDEGRFEA